MVFSTLSKFVKSLVRSAPDFYAVAVAWRRKPHNAAGLTPDEAAEECRAHFLAKLGAAEALVWKAHIEHEAELARRARQCMLVLGYA